MNETGSGPQVASLEPAAAPGAPAPSAVPAAQGTPAKAPKAASKDIDEPKTVVQVVALADILAAAKRGEVTAAKVFAGASIASVKVRRGPALVQRIDIPVRSLSKGEVGRILAEERPKPPKRRRPVEAGSAVANELGMSQGGAVVEADLTDETYQKDQRAWVERLGLGILSTAIDSELVNFDLMTVVPIGPEHLDARIKALASWKLSAHQLDRLTNDVSELTELIDQERMSFFGAGSGS